MPSPLGHALAGVAAGWIVAPPRSRKDAVTWGTLFACAAMAPDLDLFASVHRGPTHSLAAALTAGALTWIVSVAMTSRGRDEQRREGKDTWQS